MNGETDFDYHKRLIMGKLVDKTIDEDYSELSEYVYGKRYSSDFARRMMYGSRHTIDLIESSLEDGNCSSFFNKLELEKEKIKIKTEKNEYNKWLREDAREQLFLEKIIEAIEKNDAPFPTVDDYIVDEDFDIDKEGVLCFADCHFGKSFKIYGLDNKLLHEYNSDIFYKRMNSLLSNTIKRGKENSLNKIKVLFLGDALDGFLRHSQLKTLEYGVVDSAIIYGKYMAKWLFELSRYFFVEYYQVCGNHGELRLLDGRKNEHLNDNIEKVTLEIIKAYNINNDRLKIVENKSGNIYTDICGFNILGVHGEFKESKNAIQNYMNTYCKDIDYLICGHKHHNFMINCGYNKYIIGVGSIVGVDDFSMRILRTSNASANFLIFQQGVGKIIEYSIMLD